MALVASFFMTGCFFDVPLTEISSRNINTRLLGVYQYIETPKEEGGEAITHRVAVIPKDENRYRIFYRNESKKPVRVEEWEGWISIVDGTEYLSIKNVTAGSPLFGKYTFLEFKWGYPYRVEIRFPNLDGYVMENSYQMRQAMRAQLKANALFPFAGSGWDGIARIFWDRTTDDPMVMIPEEFEKGPLHPFPNM